jgi:hypothetical protein
LQGAGVVAVVGQFVTGGVPEQVARAKQALESQH